MIWIPPIVTVFLFAASAICGRKLTTMMDSMWANWFRLILAALFLLGIAWGAAWLARQTEPLRTATNFTSPAFPWFFFSGIVGFGLGDMALFLAYARLGSRLTLVLNLCLAPLFATVGEVLWLRTPVGPWQVLAMAVAVLGVIIAVGGGGETFILPGHRGWGVFWAVIAGFGQGFGGVISRYANRVAGLAEIPSTTQAFQRCLGGLLWVTVATLACYPAIRRAGKRVFHEKARLNRLAPWLLGAVLFGPAIGVSFYQWSLKLVANAAHVQAVVATTPIAVIPLAWMFEGDRPSARSVLGAIIAVIGVVAICLVGGR